MTTAVERIIGQKSGMPSLDKLRDAVKKQGLDVDIRNFSLGNFKFSDSEKLFAMAVEKMERTFNHLVALVGIKRLGELAVSAEINAAISELAPNLLIDKSRPDDMDMLVYELARNNFDKTNPGTHADFARDDIVRRIESAYNEVCGPAKNAGKAALV